MITIEDGDVSEEEAREWLEAILSETSPALRRATMKNALIHARRQGALKALNALGHEINDAASALDDWR